MPRGLSSTILPANTVLRACTAALKALEIERQEVEDTVVKDFCKGKFFMSRQRALLTMPGHMKIIFEEYRKHDKEVLRALRGLAQAASDADPTFTVEVTADDFRLLEAFYKSKG